MPRFHSFHAMPFAKAAWSYCYAPREAATRERNVPIQARKSSPAEVSPLGPDPCACAPRQAGHRGWQQTAPGCPTASPCPLLYHV